ncbi:MAG: hypothetical protein RJQ00_00955 [Vicingaceae bacterium]
MNLISQNDSLNYEAYYPGFPFQEGIYTSFEDFKLNDPAVKTDFERRGADLYAYNDSLRKMILIDPEKIWGYSQVGNIYISSNDSYWRIINIGRLAQYSAITISVFRTIDSFGFSVEQQTKSMQQLFLDMETGKSYILSAENLMPFIDEQPLLKERFRNMKRIKDRELILVLKAYNELNPIYFPVYD